MKSTNWIYLGIFVMGFTLTGAATGYLTSRALRNAANVQRFTDTWYNHTEVIQQDETWSPRVKRLFSEDLPRAFADIARDLQARVSEPSIKYLIDKNWREFRLKPGKAVQVDPFSGATAKPVTAQDSVIFAQFLYIIIKRTLDLTAGPLNFNSYSDSVLTRLSPAKDGETQLPILLPRLRAYRFYMARKNSRTMVYYPRQNIDFPALYDPSQRPWWEAAFDHTFPSAFGTGSSGLTFTYADVENTREVNLVRTFWYVFMVDKESYVMCLDFFVEADPITPVVPNTFAIIRPFQQFSFALTAALVGGILLSIAARLLLGARIEALARRMFNVRTDESYWHPRLQRSGVRHYVGNTQEVVTISDSIQTEQGSARLRELHGSWRIGTAQAEVGGRQVQSVHQSAESRSIQAIEKTFNLNLKTERFIRAVELWHVLDVADHPISVAHFEVTWQNTVYRQDDLVIELVYRDPDSRFPKRFLEPLRVQLENHLLKNEGDSFTAVVDRETVADSPAMPDSLGRSALFRQLLTQGKDLTKRKILVQDFEELAEFYDEEVFAVCSLHFLELLEKSGKYKSILARRVESRIFVEKEHSEFQRYIDGIESRGHLTPERAAEYRGMLANIKVLRFQDSLNNQLLRHDFAIVMKGRRVEYVLYNLDDLTDDAGWISWRDVDKHYYQELYKYIELAGAGSFNAP